MTKKACGEIITGFFVCIICITKRAYSRVFSGAGAGLYGGRWNPRGINLLYTAGYFSLAHLEYLANNVHLISPPDICLAKIVLNTDHQNSEILEIIAPFNLDARFFNKAN